MSRRVKKSDLPTRVCICCKKPFNWRKKWERVWSDVKYCSKRCRVEFKTQ
ncbi:MAG: DUF2256 domain-containing protein [Pseudomonadota bacterium]|nr:DUF2256 domain-containing protein [Pseudomonadota bacterium]MEC9044535.1 DUF2256 domain-containing protein [Pseudomonadota bacterium]